MENNTNQQATVEEVIPPVENTNNDSKTAEEKLAEMEIKYKKKPFYDFMKRFFDLLFSFIAIVLLSWLLLILAILVKCTSKGPAIYVSRRIGKNGKKFSFLKFRSMRVGADKELESLMSQSEREGTFKMKDDPRVTKFGKFIRKTSLDELPQLFNIFLGQMSFVGPRPCLDYEYDQIKGTKGEARFMVKQGLTGLWQVSGRADTTFLEQQMLDVEYVNKRGLFYDAGILFKTIPAVLKHEGAE